jgi:zinc D-Ala-D-Ala carboxypeptidase
MKTNRLSTHFDLSELTRSATALRLGINNSIDDPIILENLRQVCINILEPVRQHFEVPFTPESGYRCPELNTKVGGDPKSQHMMGQAVDFEIPGISNYEVALYIKQNLVFDQLILECYTPGILNSGWVHCSFSTGYNRHQVKTYLGKGKYLDGLVA